MESSSIRDLDIDMSAEKEILKKKKVQKLKQNVTKTRKRHQGLRRYRAGSRKTVNSRKNKVSEKPLQKLEDKVTI